MGRPDPCILFAQSFVHAQLNEYVDEVLFAEPVVITACEIIEQNASPTNSTISLVGATSPPSFALEVFVQCEGESRFRRLSSAFLYSPSSSNLLEVEAVVTSHLVIRGSYRSLTMVIYGNTAEDLGQFNIEFDLDSSLANLVCSPSEGKLEDLPPAFCPTYLPFEESISSFKTLSLPASELDLSNEMKDFLYQLLKFHQFFSHERTILKVVCSVVSATCSYISGNSFGLTVNWDKERLRNLDKEKERQRILDALMVARGELLELYKCDHSALSKASEALEEEILHDPNTELATSELLVYMYNQFFPFDEQTSAVANKILSQSKTSMLQLGIGLLLCSTSESCFHFVNNGGLEQLAHMINVESQRSPATVLMLLAVTEHATRHAVGCEGFLGWWRREDENIPVGSSEGYSCLLSLLLQIQRPDVASLATYVLHRLRFYEIASRYESAVLSILGNLSADWWVRSDRSNVLLVISHMLTNLLKLLKFHFPIEDPSPLDLARRSVLGQAEGISSYKATIDSITYSKYNFATQDIDAQLLSLLKERGFLPLSAALLSSPILRSGSGPAMGIFVEIAASIELMLLFLLQSRSGLSFLLLQPEATATVILSLKAVEDLKREECLTLRHATLLISKGFFCSSDEIGVIAELQLRVIHLVDHLLATSAHCDEQLWLLWELCAFSRSDSGRQALMVMGYFPEAVSFLLECLRSFKDLELTDLNSGSSPSSLIIFHCIAEIFEVLVADSAASSLSCWIEHAVELHKALHSLSPGSNRKDAPTRLLEWIDAGVVYQKNGAIGLLRYAAVLASGGDAHLSSTSVLVSDSVDVENVVGDSISNPDSQIVDNLLGKLVSDKYFDGISLRSSSLVQLTTAFRILAFIAENSVVAASLFEEGAVTLIYVVLVNCKHMLERSSNNYDYLVDEGAECTSTSDLLLERSHEQSLVDLLVPSLLLLISLLQQLKEAKEQYRNTKLLNALLKLHREVSPKVAACATDSSLPFPTSALGLHSVCRLLGSALACWPIFGWAPGLFLRLFESVLAMPLLAFGPKDACSMLCLLVDLLPEEGIWLWKNEVPAISALTTLSVGTILGSQGEGFVDWYLRPNYLALLLGRLGQQQDKIAQIVLNFACTTLEVIQDMLRVFIVRIACQRSEFASNLLRPILIWMNSQINENPLSETNIFKVYRLLNFVGSLLEHPCSQLLLLKEGIIRILANVLERCCDASSFNENFISDRVQGKNTIPLSWTLPIFKSLSLIFSSPTSMGYSGLFDDKNTENLKTEECPLVARELLKLCQVLPAGKELLACVVAFKELASFAQDRRALTSLIMQAMPIFPEVIEQDGMSGNVVLPAPLSDCFKKLRKSLDSKDYSALFSIEAVHALSLSALFLCTEDKSLEGIKLFKVLFGIPYDLDDTVILEEKLKDVHELIGLLDQRPIQDVISVFPYKKISLLKVKGSVQAMLSQLQRPARNDDMFSSNGFVPTDADTPMVSELPGPEPAILMTNIDDIAASFAYVWKLIEDFEKSEEFFLGGLSEKFMWDCPDSLPDKLMVPSLPAKRKPSSADASNRRPRDNMGFETVASNAFSRSMGAPSTPAAPSRRDTFRQRKPNTSRPPSMHVDDYVARERNIDGISSSSNVVGSSQRGGSTSGRPPSIHVDEFMARQRERMNPTTAPAGDMVQVTNGSLVNDNVLDKSETSRKLRADLDDDLHEIDIVFDEESESDDRLPFPQPDDNLQTTPLMTGESPPVSIVEESEGDTNGDTRSDFPSRSSVSAPETVSFDEANVSSEKNYPRTNSKKPFIREQSDESKYSSPYTITTSKGLNNAPPINSTGFPPNLYNTSLTQPTSESRLPPSSFHRDSPQRMLSSSIPAASKGYHEQKTPVNQPPLPPVPPPIVSSVPSQTTERAQSHSSHYVQTARDLQPPLPSGYPLQQYDVTASNAASSVHVQSETALSASSSYMASLVPSQPMVDYKHSWTTGTRFNEAYTSGTSIRPLPPLPPNPPPFSASALTQSLIINSSSHSSFSSSQIPLPSHSLSDMRLGLFSTSNSPSYMLSPFTSPLLLARPASAPGTLAGSPTQQQGQNLPVFSAPILSPLSSIQSIQTRPPPPPPPPQVPRPPHLSQHIRPSLQVPQMQTDQAVSLQNPIQLQLQPLQVPKQLQIPQLHAFYQAQQHDTLPQVPQPLLEQTQSLNLQHASQQQQDSGMTLQQYFASPEAIQSLLSDRDKLCQLLEQHPKLMQMLQERLGQL